MVRQWDIFTTDISKAFLQGVPYEELADVIGEMLQGVNSFLPAIKIPILRNIPVYESFDPIKEVFHCDKRGTDAVGAPRALSPKLKSVLGNKVGMR